VQSGKTLGAAKCSLMVAPAQTAGPGARRCGIGTADQPGLRGPATERLRYRVDRVRMGTDDRLGQRLESSHL
jgi:hypothetical protein